MSAHHSTCVLTHPDQFFVRICGCGVVHLSFGPVTINATPETVLAIAQTLEDASGELEKRVKKTTAMNGEPPLATDLVGNIVTGRFPPLASNQAGRFSPTENGSP